MPAKRDVLLVNEAINVASASAQATLPSNCFFNLSTLIKLAVTIISSKHKVYYAFLSTPIVFNNLSSKTVLVLKYNKRLLLLIT
jgi:hypothetical protein